MDKAKFSIGDKVRLVKTSAGALAHGTTGVVTEIITTETADGISGTIKFKRDGDRFGTHLTAPPDYLEKVVETVTINEQQRFYVIPCGDGHSCLGFDRVMELIGLYGAWLNRNGVAFAPPADLTAGTVVAYETYCEAVRLIGWVCTTTGKWCDAELTEQLIGLEGKRVEVVDRYGETRRFRVGRSTGFIKIHLEVVPPDGSGGGAVTGAPFKSVRVIK